MEIFYIYDSDNLIKEKFATIGLKLKKTEDNRINKIVVELLSMAKKDFLKESSAKFNLVDLFNVENSEKFLNIYRKYFFISEEYFASFFMNRFFEPNNFNSVWLYENKDNILKKFPEFEEIYFKDNDLEILQLTYSFYFIFELYGNKPWNKSLLVNLYPDYFKKTSSGAEWKANSKVRKIKYFEKYFGILDTFDKVNSLKSLSEHVTKFSIEKNKNAFFHDSSYNELSDRIDEKISSLESLYL